MSQVVHEPSETPLKVHSLIDRPVAALGFLERSLLFAELSMIAYNDASEATRAAAAIGFPEVTYFDYDGSQALRFRNRHDCVVACRGTEPHEWNDVRAGVSATSALAETVGKVHRGFKREVDDLWPELETALTGNDLPLWFCGHSLGGAMATICAARCLLSHIASNPAGLFSYGSPRVGNKRYVHHVDLPHYRWVHNNDVVTRVPPVWWGYRHAGDEWYLDHRGQVRQLSVEGKRWDRWLGLLRGLVRWRIDPFADHAIHRYIEALAAAVLAERQAAGDRRQGPPPPLSRCVLGGGTAPRV